MSCVLEEGVRRLDRTRDEVVLGIDRTAGVTFHRSVCLLTRLVRSVWDANGSTFPDVLAAGRQSEPVDTITGLAAGDALEEVICPFDGAMDQVEILFDAKASVALGGKVGLLAVGLLVRSVGHADFGPAPDVAAVQEAVGVLDSTIEQVVLAVDRGAGVPRRRVVLLLAILFWRDAQVCAGPNVIAAARNVQNALLGANTHNERRTQGMCWPRRWPQGRLRT